MSMSSTSHAGAQPGLAHGTLRSLGAALKRAWLAYLEYRMHREIARQLYAMKDSELKDIGLSRADIEFAIRGPGRLPPRHLRGSFR